MRKFAIRRIDHNPASCKWQSVLQRKLGGDMGFHIYRDGPGALEQSALFGFVRHYPRARDRRMNRARQQRQHPSRPDRVNGVALPIADDRLCHDPIARGKIGSEPAGRPEADYAPRSRCDGGFQSLSDPLPPPGATYDR
jgi:hypothetical protein